MTHAAALSREDAITDALRAANDAIGDEPPSAQALRIIEALKRMRSAKPVRVTELAPIDYLEKVQAAGRAAWIKQHGGEHGNIIVADAEAVAGIDTPIGRLKIITWRTVWNGQRGQRAAWRAEYYLDEQPITIREIKAAGLAARPTTRRRQKKST